MSTTPAWCRRCGRLGLAEDLPTLDHLDAQRADFARWDPDAGAPHVARVRRRQRWRTARTAPPKCVECGSTDLVFLPIGRRVPHPDGAGWITLDVTGFAETSPLGWFFTPEGDRLPEDAVPAELRRP